MRTCWTREQLQGKRQGEVVKGKQREYWHPDPARQAGWQETGRYVPGQVGTGRRVEVGCVYTLSKPQRPQPSGNPRGLHRAGRAPPMLVSWGSGSKRKEAVAADRLAAQGFGRQVPPAAPTRPSRLPLGRSSAGLTVAATASTKLRGCSSGRAGRAPVPQPARLPPRPNLPAVVASFRARHCSAPTCPTGKVRTWYLRLGARPVPPQHCRPLRHDHSASV